MQSIDEILENLKVKVEEYFGDDATGHSIDHLERTKNYALYLCKKEGGDPIVATISAYIHDVHRIMGSKEKRFVSPKESLPVVEEFLKDVDITPLQKEKILSAIEHHEEYDFGKNKVSTNQIEALILQDADNLDAIGAVGLVRAITYSIAHNMPVYDQSVPLYRNEYSESQNDVSTIHHIYNKLLRLGENMNTKTARKLAQKKTKLLKDFMNMYIEENS